jgi:hypothetical protein
MINSRIELVEIPGESTQYEIIIPIMTDPQKSILYDSRPFGVVPYILKFPSLEVPMEVEMTESALCISLPSLEINSTSCQERRDSSSPPTITQTIDTPSSPPCLLTPSKITVEFSPTGSPFSSPHKTLEFHSNANSNLNVTLEPLSPSLICQQNKLISIFSTPPQSPLHLNTYSNNKNRHTTMLIPILQKSQSDLVFTNSLPSLDLCSISGSLKTTTTRKTVSLTALYPEGVATPRL